MLEQTQAIVLHHIKYSDSSAIAHLYTEKYGRLPIMVRHSKSKKAVSKKSILQPLFMLKLDLQYKQSREIQQCKEIVNIPAFSSIPFDVVKSSIALFLSEFLSKVLKEEEANPALFDFLIHSIQLFDEINEGRANFHLVFMYELSKFLGFYPDNNYSNTNLYFNLREGFYGSFESADGTTLGKELSESFFFVGKYGFNDLLKIKLARQQRLQLLNALVKFYQYHLPGIGEIKSLEVLKQVFEA